MLRSRMQQVLVQADAVHLRRTLRPRAAAHMQRTFASNDYLGLRHDPRVIEAFQRGLQQYGSGSGASPLVTGYSDAHQVLAEELADWLGVDRVLLFSSGYAANQGVLSTLSEVGMVPVLDRLCHASIYDGVQSERIARFHHQNIEHAETVLRQLKMQPDQTAMLVSEGVFSMDGDQAPVARLHDLAKRSNALLMLDDAHGLGVTGARGLGVMDTTAYRPDVLTGTFGKAFGVAGAFVATDHTIADFLVQRCRHFIYSTAFPAAQAEAIRASLKCVRSEPERRGRLFQNIHRFCDYAAQLNLRLAPSETPIQPLVVGDAGHALQLAEHLRAAGFECTAIRYPTVPKHTARLRFALSAAHTAHDIDALFDALHVILRKEPALHDACTVHEA
ncbi:aminotransferase class I/II-fold pyridoxal phosphate-dependent enzyme [Aliidiomarina sanyensis]|uniref:8-amino-7-oxononanoate synthase n=1 Tax=Aliidiomarina sanyensis TaxID=1249555 RepID=A0A432WRZ3_9GAMM|nr:8-amino-7-oxononanoate synthase [Aliidiomarina sanyensis]RUO36531.1 8-amino-7-oxononanoate synthase [Aliidiomarina sanyensis]